MRDLVFYYKTKHERARFFTKTEISQQETGQPDLFCEILADTISNFMLTLEQNTLKKAFIKELVE